MLKELNSGILLTAHIIVKTPQMNFLN